MKKTKLLAYSVLIFASVFFAHAAFAASTITSTTTQTATDFIVNYQYTDAPAQTINIYSWISNAQTGTWVNQNNLLITVPATSTQVTKSFSVDYNFSQLGLNPGTQYVYYLADGTTDSADLLTNPSYFIVPGQVQVGDNDGTCNPTYDTTVNQPVIASTPMLCSNGTATNFAGDPVNGPWTWTCPAVGTGGTTDNCTATLATSGATSGATPVCALGPFLPSASNASLCTIGTANNISDGTSNWTWSCTNPPQTAVSCSATVSLTGAPATQNLSGVTISFPSNYTITNTTAAIPVLVSVATATNVNLSAYVAPVGVNLQNSQPVLTQLVDPSTPVNTTINFTGLTAGQAYYFSIENNTTGVYGPALQFTTTGGTTTTNATPTTNTGGGTSPGLTVSTNPILNTGIVPQCGRTDDGTGKTVGTQMCTFNDFMTLISNIIQYGLIILGPIIAILAMYAGAMIIWLGRLPDPTSEQSANLRKYKALLVRAAVGILIIVLAWTLISTVLIALGVQKGYILLDIFSGH